MWEFVILKKPNYQNYKTQLIAWMQTQKQKQKNIRIFHKLKTYKIETFEHNNHQEANISSKLLCLTINYSRLSDILYDCIFVYSVYHLPIYEFFYHRVVTHIIAMIYG